MIPRFLVVLKGNQQEPPPFRVNKRHRNILEGRFHFVSRPKEFGHSQAGA